MAGRGGRSEQENKHPFFVAVGDPPYIHRPIPDIVILLVSLSFFKDNQSSANSKDSFRSIFGLLILFRG